MFLLAQVADVSVKTFLGILGGASGFTVLATVTWAAYTRRICTRGELDDANNRTQEMRKERDEWKATALRLLDVTERAQDNTVQAAQVAKQAIAKTGSVP